MVKYVCPKCGEEVEAEKRPNCSECNVPMFKKEAEGKNYMFSFNPKISRGYEEKRLIFGKPEILFYIKTPPEPLYPHSPFPRSLFSEDYYITIGYHLPLWNIRREEADLIRKCIQVYRDRFPNKTLQSVSFYDKDTRAKVVFDGKGEELKVEKDIADVEDLRNFRNIKLPSVEKVVELTLLKHFKGELQTCYLLQTYSSA